MEKYQSEKHNDYEEKSKDELYRGFMEVID